MVELNSTIDLYVDAAPRSGVENMAIDEWLLLQALERDASSIRIYQWIEPTVSVGHFQQNKNDIDRRLIQLPHVRRLSGGGAILHHHEITYSLALPARHCHAQNPTALYSTVHRAIVEELAAIGVQANIRGEVARPNDDPFLCFSRQDPNDIVVRSTKVVGSAQRRRKGAVLQHGSLLLSASELIPELFGIAELSPNIDVSSLCHHRLGNAITRAISENNGAAKQFVASEAGLESLIEKYTHCLE